MSNAYVSKADSSKFNPWNKNPNRKAPFSFILELTARCNNNCRHCYNNLDAGDMKTKSKELSFEEIKRIVDEAASIGCLYCLITGGEPLLREDFPEIYAYLKRHGFLVTVFTNATLINMEHIRIFKKFSPQYLQVTIYGATKNTYEHVTQREGSFDAFINGLNLLKENDIKIALTAVALHSNYHELNQMAQFALERTGGLLTLQPLLIFRHDGNYEKNRLISTERLSPQQIASLDQNAKDRYRVFETKCNSCHFSWQKAKSPHPLCCLHGKPSFSISYEGLFLLCHDLRRADLTYDMKKGNLSEAWYSFYRRALEEQAKIPEKKNECRSCPYICSFCPSHVYLETGEINSKSDYICRIAKARGKKRGNRD